MVSGEGESEFWQLNGLRMDWIGRTRIGLGWIIPGPQELNQLVLRPLENENEIFERHSNCIGLATASLDLPGEPLDICQLFDRMMDGQSARRNRENMAVLFVDASQTAE